MQPLNYRRYAPDDDHNDENLPGLIILHGLFGSLNNWNSHARSLSRELDVVSVDLRNHGSSFHDPEMTYQAMAGDVAGLLDDLNWKSCYLLGHSMGGKVAMQLALSHPQRVLRLLVADVAPVNYRGDSSEHDQVFKALEAVAEARVNSRPAADKLMQDYLESPALRQFLLANLQKTDSGTYAWRLNFRELKRSYDRLREAPVAEKPFTGPVLFIKGSRSDYIQDKHREQINALFPNSRIHVMQDTGHWVHAEHPDQFCALVREFFLQASPP